MSITNKYVGLVQVGNSGSDKGIVTLYLSGFKKHVCFELLQWHIPVHMCMCFYSHTFKPRFGCL